VCGVVLSASAVSYIGHKRAMAVIGASVRRLHNFSQHCCALFFAAVSTEKPSVVALSHSTLRTLQCAIAAFCKRRFCQLSVNLQRTFNDCANQSNTTALYMKHSFCLVLSMFASCDCLHCCSLCMISGMGGDSSGIHCQSGANGSTGQGN
jgi:hypothetical protein